MKVARSSHTTLAAIVREPLIHFTLAGTMLFTAYAWLNPTVPLVADGPVRIGQGDLGWLRETFSSQWRRDPTREEMNSLVETLVQEQLMAREARALGLDRDDTIVRRRLAQKLTFLVEETTRIGDPDDLALQKFQAANTERYRSQPRLSFQQIFYSPKRRQSPTDDAKAELAGITATKLPDGDPLPLEPAFSKIDPAGIASLFGPSFAEALVGVMPGVWFGPVKSAYGVHLVLVTEREEGKPRAFEEVRSALLGDWRRQKAAEASAAYIEKLRNKYGVVVDADPAQASRARTAAMSEAR